MSTNEHEAKSGHLFTNQFGERFLYEVNGTVFNTTGSETVYNKFFGEGMFQKDSLYIMLGTDSGLLIDYIEKNGIPDGTRYLMVEDESILTNLKKQNIFDDVNERIDICTLEEWKSIGQGYGIEKYIFAEKVHLIKSIGARDLNYDPYAALFLQLEDQYKNYAWSLVNRTKVVQFIDRQLDNIAENHTPFIGLRDTYKGKTCVILAGGPSLDESIEWIKEKKDDVVIFAVSRIAKKLIQENIKPDVVVSVDAKHGSFDIGKDILNLWQDSLFIQAYHADNYLTGQWRGKAVYLGHRIPWESKLNQENIIAAGPTVTQSSLVCAIEMGFSQIIMCGVDHCYNKEGFTHAKNTEEHEIGPLLSHIGVTIETNGGWQAETKQEFLSGTYSIISLINYAHKSGKDCTFINPSKSSAKIDMVEHIETHDIKIPESVKQQKQVYKLLPTLSISERREDLEEVLSELSDISIQLSSIKKLGNEALKYNSQAHELMDISFKNKVDDIEKKIHDKFSVASNLIKTYNAAGFLKGNLVDETREFSTKEIKIRVDDYFKNHINTADRLIKQISACKKRTQSRIEELSSSPNFELIFEQWDEDNTPGRAHILESFHTDDNILVSVENRLKEYKDKFDSILQERNTNFKNALKVLLGDIAGAKAKAIHLFNIKSIDRLKAHSENIHQHKEGSDWEYLGHLVDGYINELENNNEFAYEHYEKLLESEYQLDALKRILQISIANRDNDSALLALECLSSVIPIYMPYHAEMLNLTGNYEDAINTYTEYLKKVPEDISSWLKLGKLYLDLNVSDSAKWVFEQVILVEPENIAAKSYLRQIS